MIPRTSKLSINDYQSFEDHLNPLHDSILIPNWFIQCIKSKTCEIIENDNRFQYLSLQPSALYSICVLISEWILHITGTCINSVDNVIEIWSTISKHFDKFLLKKKQINELQINSMINHIHNTNKQEDIDTILSEIKDYRKKQKEYEQLQHTLTPLITPAESELSSNSYEEFNKHVNDKLYFQPIPDPNENFNEWLEWSKVKWNYNKYLKKYKHIDEENKKAYDSLLYHKKQKEIESNNRKTIKKKARELKLQKRLEEKREKMKEQAIVYAKKRQEYLMKKSQSLSNTVI